MKITALATRHTVRFAKTATTSFSEERMPGITFEELPSGVRMRFEGVSKRVPWANVLEVTELETPAKAK